MSVRITNQAVPAAPLTLGEGQIQRNVDVSVTEEKQNLILLEEGASLADVVQGLNRLGASPRDLITILQAIKRAGALRADIQVM